MSHATQVKEEETQIEEALREEKRIKSVGESSSQGVGFETDYGEMSELLAMFSDALDTDDAAELAGMMIGRSDRTIRDWKSHFFANDGAMPESKQGKYQRSGVVWKNEKLNVKTTK